MGNAKVVAGNTNLVLGNLSVSYNHYVNPPFAQRSRSGYSRCKQNGSSFDLPINRVSYYWNRRGVVVG